MANKIIKIACVAVAAEVVYALGKGHMLAVVRKFDTETYADMREYCENMIHDENIPVLGRLSAALICAGDIFVTEFYRK